MLLKHQPVDMGIGRTYDTHGFFGWRSTDLSASNFHLRGWPCGPTTFFWDTGLVASCALRAPSWMCNKLGASSNLIRWEGQGNASGLQLQAFVPSLGISMNIYLWGILKMNTHYIDLKWSKSQISESSHGPRSALTDCIAIKELIFAGHADLRKAFPCPWLTKGPLLAIAACEWACDNDWFYLVSGQCSGEVSGGTEKIGL